MRMIFLFRMHVEIHATMLILYLNPERAEFAHAGARHQARDILAPDRSIIPFTQINPVTGTQILFPGHSPFHSIRTTIRQLIVCLLYGQPSHYPLEKGGAMILIDIAYDIIYISTHGYSWNRFINIQLIGNPIHFILREAEAAQKRPYFDILVHAYG